MLSVNKLTSCFILWNLPLAWIIVAVDLIAVSFKALGLFSNKQYDPKADMRFIMKLPTERCLSANSLP